MHSASNWKVIGSSPIGGRFFLNAKRRFTTTSNVAEHNSLILHIFVVGPTRINSNPQPPFSNPCFESRVDVLHHRFHWPIVSWSFPPWSSIDEIDRQSIYIPPFCRTTYLFSAWSCPNFSRCSLRRSDMWCCNTCHLPKENACRKSNQKWKNYVAFSNSNDRIWASLASIIEAHRRNDSVTTSFNGVGNRNWKSRGVNVCWSACVFFLVLCRVLEWVRGLNTAGTIWWVFSNQAKVCFGGTVSGLGSSKRLVFLSDDARPVCLSWSGTVWVVVLTGNRVKSQSRILLRMTFNTLTN